MDKAKYQRLLDRFAKGYYLYEREALEIDGEEFTATLNARMTGEALSLAQQESFKRRHNVAVARSFMYLYTFEDAVKLLWPRADMRQARTDFVNRVERYTEVCRRWPLAALVHEFRMELDN
jgi:hypothetical protein